MREAKEDDECPGFQGAVPYRRAQTTPFVSASQKWNEFQATSQEGKVTFFDAAVNHVSMLMAHF